MFKPHMKFYLLLASIGLAIAFGCSGVRPPKERLVRTDDTFDKDLTKLHEYLGEMPVEIAVEGYPTQSMASLPVEVSPDSVEAIITSAVITQIDRESTILRPSGDNLGATVRVPTKNITRISANGVRTRSKEEGSGMTFILPIVLGVLGIASALYEPNLKGATGCEGGCLALGLLLGLAAVVSLAIILIASSLSSNAARTTVEYEAISKTWIIQSR